MGDTDRVSLHSPTCLGTCSADQYGLKQTSTCLGVSAVGNKGVHLEDQSLTGLSPGCVGSSWVVDSHDAVGTATPQSETQSRVPGRGPQGP